MQLTLTESALNRLKQLITENIDSKTVLRISIDGGGCSGYMYHYDLVDEIEDTDYIAEYDDNLKVVVDLVSQPFIDGAVVDFIEELGSSHFEIKNKNAATKCGCGRSFGV